METIYLRYLDTNIGVLTLASTERGLCHIDFPGKLRSQILRQIEKSHGACEFWDEDVLGKKSLVNQRAEHELRDYFDKTLKEFTLPLDVRGTDFQLAVWRELCNIPYGKTASYGDVAKAIGRPRACRAVGGANHNNPVSIVVPCHRVVGSDGSLTGYGGGLEVKRFLLDLEARD